MKGEVNETSCPGASALPSLNTVRCLWCQQKAVDPSRKAVAGGAGVAGQGRAASSSPAPGHLQLSHAPLCSLQCFLVGCCLFFAPRLWLQPGFRARHGVLAQAVAHPMAGSCPRCCVCLRGDTVGPPPARCAEPLLGSCGISEWGFPAVGYPLLCSGLSSV